jgi:hypothetical protein
VDVLDRSDLRSVAVDNRFAAPTVDVHRGLTSTCQWFTGVSGSRKPRATRGNEHENELLTFRARNFHGTWGPPIGGGGEHTARSKHRAMHRYPGCVPLAVDTTVLMLGILGVVAAIVAIVVIVSPWKGVRDEPPLPTDVETRLLLGEDPAVVAADVDGDDGVASVHDLDAGQARDEARRDGENTFEELERLAEEPPEHSGEASDDSVGR